MLMCDMYYDVGVGVISASEGAAVVSQLSQAVLCCAGPHHHTTLTC